MDTKGQELAFLAGRLRPLDCRTDPFMILEKCSETCPRHGNRSA